MAKKKTNFISYELQRLDAYMSQLTSYLDSNPPNGVQDRIERIPTERGFIIKVIATKESQIKLFMDTLERLPKVLNDINDLRKQVEGIKVDDEIRGEQSQPGFMRAKQETEEDDDIIIPDNDDDDEPDFDGPRKQLPPSTNVPKSNFREVDDEEFDDDSFFQEEN